MTSTTTTATDGTTRYARILGEIVPESICAIIDTREQMPLDLAPLQTTTGMLGTGDYSVVGLEKVIAVERKSLGDLLDCVGRERERFDKAVQRMMAYPVKVLVVEATWHDIERGGLGNL